MLIKCPECNHDVSDKAKTCPNCGLDIQEYLRERAEAEEKRKAEEEEKKAREIQEEKERQARAIREEQEKKNREIREENKYCQKIYKEKKFPENTSLLLEQFKKTGSFPSVLYLALCYEDQKDYKHTLLYLKQAEKLADTDERKGLVYNAQGRTHKALGNKGMALFCYKKSKDINNCYGIKALADLYNPDMHNGYQKDAHQSLELYYLAIRYATYDRNLIAICLNNAGCIFGGRKNYIFAAAFCWLAYRKSDGKNDIIVNNYKTYISHATKYRRMIEHLRTESDIPDFADSLACSRVELSTLEQESVAYIRQYLCPDNTNTITRPVINVSEKSDTSSQEEKKKCVPHCPTCGSTNVRPVDQIKKDLSIGVSGVRSAYFGKTYECLNCGYKW